MNIITLATAFVLTMLTMAPAAAECADDNNCADQQPAAKVTTTSLSDGDSAGDNGGTTTTAGSDIGDVGSDEVDALFARLQEECGSSAANGDCEALSSIRTDQPTYVTRELLTGKDGGLGRRTNSPDRGDGGKSQEAKKKPRCESIFTF